MKKIFTVGLLVFTFLLGANLSANNSHTSKYKGQENREIKSLSSEDITELKKGAGWGLAKAAELNGYPGPSHLLQMKDRIHLSEEQEDKIKKLFKNMQQDAIKLGTKLVHLEKQLNDSFSNKSITEDKLKTYLKEIMKTRESLRYVHLITHLKTPEILSKKQIDLYNNLRGYSKNIDPCLNIPEGHDKTMWKKHNGCK
jgi:Spy/CpxP family protein refolding chaperone